MTSIAGLVVDREARARIAQALRGHGHAVFCESSVELRAVLARQHVTAVLMELRDRAGALTTSMVALLRRDYPSVPVVVYAALAPTTPHDLLAAAKAGASGIVLKGVDDAGVALRTALTSAADDCVARRIMGELEPALPGRVRRRVQPILEYCVLHARSAPTVDGLARALGIDRKTLVNRLRSAGLPPPSAVIGWCRLLLAAHLVEDAGRTVEQVALELDFPSGAALRNMLKRYTGLQPREVRERGGLACALAAFRDALGGRRPEARRSIAERSAGVRRAVPERHSGSGAAEAGRSARRSSVTESPSVSP
ncbi:MAG TPA: helix-turn-helix domain-containing protein [Gemmatimonadaceae bacterium]|nr:helix-turn-helix domain-containing protein [Gemmatimonadaceae bacterium]